MTQKVNVWKKTQLRMGGAESGINGADSGNNVIVKDLDTGDYEALYQCVGEKITKGAASNHYWVKIRLDDGREGWVGGVYVDESGDNMKLIRDTNGHYVPEEPTRFV